MGLPKGPRAETIEAGRSREWALLNDNELNSRGWSLMKWALLSGHGMNNRGWSITRMGPAKRQRADTVEPGSLRELFAYM